MNPWHFHPIWKYGVAIPVRLSNKGDMKRFALLTLAACFGLGACERHEFEETRKLHEHHGSGDKHADGEHPQ